MRAQEFLFEYRRDITAKNFTQSLVNRIVNDPSLASEYRGLDSASAEHQTTIVNGFLQNYFEAADPTPNKQYVQWLVRMYISGQIKRIEDVTATVAPVLEKYHRLKLRKLLPDHIRDINQFKTILQFYTEVSNLSEPAVALTNKGESSVFYEDNTVRVLIPHNQDAACYYGQGTRWCTAASKNNMFGRYNDMGSLYIIIPKKPTYPGEKYQVQFETSQFMDETDTPIEPSELTRRLPNLRTAFKDIAINTLNLDFMPSHLIRPTVIGAARALTNAKEITLRSSTKDNLNNLANDTSALERDVRANIETLQDSANLLGDIAHLKRDFVSLLFRDDIEDAHELNAVFTDALVDGIDQLKEALKNES